MSRVQGAREDGLHRGDKPSHPHPIKDERKEQVCRPSNALVAIQKRARHCDLICVLSDRLKNPIQLLKRALATGDQREPGRCSCPLHCALIIIVVEQVVKRVVTTLLHDAVELLGVDLAIAVAIGLVDHVLELLLGHVLTKLLGNTLQVLE